MKVANLETSRAIDSVRGRRSTKVAGSKGMTWRDGSTESVGQIWDMTAEGMTFTDNEDGTGTLAADDAAGDGTNIAVDDSAWLVLTGANVQEALDSADAAIDALPGPGSGSLSSCLAARTTSQAITSDPMAIAFNATDIYDPDGWHNPASNNTRLTCPGGTGGKVFTVFGSTEVDQAGLWRLQVRKNGSSVEVYTSFAALGVVGAISGGVYLDDGDYIELLVQNLVTGNIIVTDAPTRFGVMG